jgi:hypothetical protein
MCVCLRLPIAGTLKYLAVSLFWETSSFDVCGDKKKKNLLLGKRGQLVCVEIIID